MTAKLIPLHAWPLILPFLRNPIPPPLSEPADRSVLRQPALACASRVSRLFHSECHKLLYTHIVTENLPTLFRDIHLPSNYRRFANTRSLYIEYGGKGQAASYPELLGGNREVWLTVAPEVRDLKAQVMAECETEVRRLTLCLKQVNSIGMGVALPRLATLAVASVFGVSPTVWRLYDDLNYRSWESSPTLLPSDPAGCVFEIGTFLSSGNLQHVCLRDALGPLSLSSWRHVSVDGHPAYTTTIHLHPQKIHALPLALGSKVRYSSDSPSQQDWNISLRPTEEVFRRKAMQRSSYERAGTTRDKADIEIFSSTGLFRGKVFNPTASSLHLASIPSLEKQPYYPLSIAEQTKMVARLGSVTQDLFRRGSGLQDVVKWRISAETPICESCGSGPPGETGGWVNDAMWG